MFEEVTSSATFWPHASNRSEFVLSVFHYVWAQYFSCSGVKTFQAVQQPSQMKWWRTAVQHTFINTLQIFNFCMQSLQRVCMLLLEEQNSFLQRGDACAVCVCPGLSSCFWALEAHRWSSDHRVTGQESGVSHPVQISHPAPAGQVSQGGAGYWWTWCYWDDEYTIRLIIHGSFCL